MKKYQKLGKKVIQATKTVVEKAVKVINNVTVPVRASLTQAGHKAIAKALTSKIYSVSYVCKHFVVRVVESHDTNKPYELKINMFYGLGTNNPYTRAFIKFTKEKFLSATIQIKEFNKDTNSIEDKYSITTNVSKPNKSTYVETDSVGNVVLCMIEKDLKSLYSDAKLSQYREKLKEQIEKELITFGIQVNSDVATIGDENTNESNCDKHFKMASWSPSSERNETALFTSLNRSIAFNFMNTISGNTIYKAVSSSRSLEKLKKFSKRLGQLGTPCVEAGKLGNKDFGVVIYMKKIVGPADYTEETNTKLLKNKIEIDRNTYDGTGYFSVEYIVYLAGLLGRKITKSQAILIDIQARCNVIFTKILGESLSQEVMQHIKNQLIKYVTTNSSSKRILKVDAGTDVSKLNKEDYDLLIIGNDKNLGMIVDSNGAKTLNDISLQDIVNGNYQNYLLDVAKASRTKTSGQMLQKFISINKEKTMAALAKLFSYQIADRLNHLATGDIDAKNCGLSEFLFRFVEGGKQVEASLNSYIKNEIKKTESQAKKFSIDIDSIFLRAVFDFTYFLTGGLVNGILNVNPFTNRLEAYSYDVELENKEALDAIWSDDSLSVDEKMKQEAELLTGAVFKYPSPSPNERCVMTFVSSHTLIERITSHALLTTELKEILLSYFINTSYGTIKIAPNNTIKHRLAGMDADYDGVAVVFEKELVDIIIEEDTKLGFDGITIKKSL